MLTPQGKFLFDFFIAEEAAQLLLETELRVEQLQRRLIYRLRSKVDLEDVSTRFIVAALIGDEIAGLLGLPQSRAPRGCSIRASCSSTPVWADWARGRCCRGDRGALLAELGFEELERQPMNGCGSRSACPTAAAIWWSRSRRSWRAGSKS